MDEDSNSTMPFNTICFFQAWWEPAGAQPERKLKDTVKMFWEQHRQKGH